MPTWAASEWKEFCVKRLGEEFLTHQNDRALWQKIYDVPDEDIWNMRQMMKNKLIDFVRQRIPG